MNEVTGLRATLKQYQKQDHFEVVNLKKGIAKELHEIASKLYRVSKVWMPSLPVSLAPCLFVFLPTISEQFGAFVCLGAWGGKRHQSACAALLNSIRRIAMVKSNDYGSRSTELSKPLLLH